MFITHFAFGTDKGQYHLSNPVPQAQMRPLSADRPDGTESPMTVDAGHLQLEVSLLEYTVDDDADTEVHVWTMLESNIKFGLLHNMDLQFVFGVYQEEHMETDTFGSETRNGFGDMQIRLKMNVWGNDQQGRYSTAFGIMPFMTIPTRTEISGNKLEGGVSMPLSWQTGERWDLGFMAEFDVVQDDNDGGYDAAFVHTSVLGIDVTDRFGTYIEYIGTLITARPSGYQANFRNGATWQWTDDWIFDIGTQIGMTPAADDFKLFTGMTLRF